MGIFMTFSCMHIMYFHPITLSFAFLPFLLISFSFPVISLPVFLFSLFACLISVAGPVSFISFLQAHEWGIIYNHVVSLPTCLRYFSVAMINTLTNQLTERGVHFGPQFKIKSIMVSKSRQPELKAFGHIATEVREQKTMKASPQLSPF